MYRNFTVKFQVFDSAPYHSHRVGLQHFQGRDDAEVGHVGKDIHQRHNGDGDVDSPGQVSGREHTLKQADRNV